MAIICDTYRLLLYLISKKSWDHLLKTTPIVTHLATFTKIGGSFINSSRPFPDSWAFKEGCIFWRSQTKRFPNHLLIQELSPTNLIGTALRGLLQLHQKTLEKEHRNSSKSTEWISPRLHRLYAKKCSGYEGLIWEDIKLFCESLTQISALNLERPEDSLRAKFQPLLNDTAKLLTCLDLINQVILPTLSVRVSDTQQRHLENPSNITPLGEKAQEKTYSTARKGLSWRGLLFQNDSNSVNGWSGRFWSNFLKPFASFFRTIELLEPPLADDKSRVRWKCVSRMVQKIGIDYSPSNTI